MRYLIGFFVFTILNTSFAQDPTVPSAQILERLAREQPTSVATLPSTVQERLTPPVLKLKAVVMVDSDHGTALIEVDGRRVRLQLSRHATEQMNAPESLAATTLDSVIIQGLSYHVQDFSGRSVLLRNNNQTLLVQ